MRGIRLKSLLYYLCDVLHVGNEKKEKYILKPQIIISFYMDGCAYKGYIIYINDKLPLP